MSSNGMTTFKVEITETLCRVVEIEVPINDPDAALAKAHKMYRNEDIVLDSDDFVDVSYKVVENED